MGKYLPIIMTARCGSLNKAAGQLGYSHPSLWYIINNIENDLGIRIFNRTKRGVTLTEAGKELLDIMVEIEEREERLHKTAQTYHENCIQVGIFPSIAAQWLPALLSELADKRPEVAVKLVTPSLYRDGVDAIVDHTLACCFSAIVDPPGVDCFPLYEDPYYVIVSDEHELAQAGKLSLADVISKYPLIPSSESLDPDSALWNIYRAAETVVTADSTYLDPRLSVALAEKGLGVTILPALAMGDLCREHRVKAIPLDDGMHRTITLLCQKKNRRTALDNEFIKLVLRFVEELKQTK